MLCLKTDIDQVPHYHYTQNNVPERRLFIWLHFESGTKEYKIKFKGGFRFKKEAQAAASLVEVEIEEDFEINRQPLSLSSFLRSWLLDSKKGIVHKNMDILHERNGEKHLLSYFKNMDLQDIKPFMYQKFSNELADKGYSKRTVEIIHGTMFNAIQKAVVLLRIKSNSYSGFTIPKQCEPQKRQLRYLVSDHVPSF